MAGTVDWWHRKESEFRYAPPDSPVTTMLELKCDSPTSLYDPTNSSSKALDAALQEISEDEAHLPSPSFICRGTQADNPNRIILLIKWKDQPPPDFTSGTLPKAFIPLKDLGEIHVSNVAFAPELHRMMSSKTVEVVRWRFPQHEDDAVFADCFERLREFEMAIGGREGCQEFGDIIDFPRGWDSDTTRNAHYLMFWWTDAESERRFKDPNVPSSDGPPDLYLQKFAQPQEEMESCGVKAESFHVTFRPWKPSEFREQN